LRILQENVIAGQVTQVETTRKTLPVPFFVVEWKKECEIDEQGGIVVIWREKLSMSGSDFVQTASLDQGKIFLS